MNTSGGSLLPIYKMLKVEGATLTGTPPKLSGGTLYAVDPVDPTNKTQLVSVPQNFNILGSGIGDHLLLSGGDGNQTDVFYVNLSQQDSLTQITDTPTDESPFF